MRIILRFFIDLGIFFDYTDLSCLNSLIYESKDEIIYNYHELSEKGYTMNEKRDSIRIEVIDSEEAFLDLKDEWDALIEKSINPSFYSTFLFVSTAWKHYRGETDRLCILVVRRDAKLVSIAPFRIGSVKLGNSRLLLGMRLRIIRFIAEWGSGDKPVIVTTEEPGRIWDVIFQFLRKEFTQWDGIWLVEQPVNSPVLDQRVLNKMWYFTMTIPNAPSFYTSFSGTWEEFLKTRGKNTHRTWNNSRKKLLNLPDGVVFQCIDDPESMPEALKKFIDIEQSGWKKDRDFSVGGKEKNKRFYEELLVHSAQKNMGAIYLLTSGTKGIAGAINYFHNSDAYSAHTTYRSMYAKYSPGVILKTEILKTLFGTHYQECDFLGFQDEKKNTSKKNWSNGSRQTVTILVNKRNFRMVLFYKGNRLKAGLRNVVRILTGNKIAEQAKVTKQ